MLENIMNFSFLDNAASLSIPDILLALAISFCLGLCIFFVYKKTYRGVMYSSSFGISLIAMNLITCLIIIAVLRCADSNSSDGFHRITTFTDTPRFALLLSVNVHFHFYANKTYCCRIYCSIIGRKDYRG